MPRSLQAMCVAVLLIASSWAASAAPPLTRLQVPPGFHVALFSDQIPSVRGIALGDRGPYCHAGNVLDPEFGHGHACDQFAQPALQLGAHVASLGMRFYVGRMFPAAYEGAIFIAEHGSWNRSRKAGYRVVVAHIGKDGKTTGAQPFLTGFLDDQQPVGRPVDVQPLRDGGLLVSDDHNGALYRVMYGDSK